MKDWLKNVKEQLGETQKTWGWTKEKAGKKRSGNQAKRESWYNKKRFDKLSQKRARQAADALQRKDKETWEKEVSTQTPRTVATQTDLTDPWPESQPDQPDNVAYSPTVTGLEEVEVTIVPKEPMGPNDLHLVEKEHVETEENLRMVATAVEAAQRGTMALIQRLLPIDPKNNDAMNAQMVFLSDCAQAALTADDYLSAVASLVKVNQLPWWAPIGQKGGGAQCSTLIWWPAPLPSGSGASHQNQKQYMFELMCFAHDFGPLLLGVRPACMFVCFAHLTLCRTER